MWLPADERRILAAYYKILGEVGEEEAYRLGSLRHALHNEPKKIRKYEEIDDAEALPDNISEFQARIAKYTDERARVGLANKVLAARGLIQLTSHASELNVVIVALTLEGYDLGRRYSRWWDRSGLWFAAHQNHWIMFILSILGGVIGGMLLNLLSASGKP